MDKLKVPKRIHEHLFQYQKTCLKWLWELYKLRVGGVIGDEMGLGKSKLFLLKRLKGPCLIFCPATVMKQWVQEFHKWFPSFRVVILHSTGSYFVNEALKLEFDDCEIDPSEIIHKRRKIISKDSEINPKENLIKQLIAKVRKDGHIIVTTYGSLAGYKKFFLPFKWAYCVLDEGHKIRNPGIISIKLDLICKQIRTPNRIILSGTPIQNNLTELWSLYDFVYPGKLGTLPVFKTQFETPIKIGGYANATSMQVQTAYKCAVILKDFINPYLLRRMKIDVAQQLPQKTEKVLFCKLSNVQRAMYLRYLESDDVKRIFGGNQNVLSGIDILRKICNHPDLISNFPESTSEPQIQQLDSYPEINQLLNRSGKLIVLANLLKIWGLKCLKCLVFCQTRQCLTVVEKYVSRKYIYKRMDGNTGINLRSKLVDDFNQDESNLYFY
jgi:DNA excision repair protein ERCC-6